MIAVIEMWGNQFIVKQGDIIEVKRQEFNENETIVVEALLTSNEDGNDTKIWTPTVEWSKIELKVLEQFKWEKVRVFKMKSKKRYTRNKGFRPQLTKLEVLTIS